MPSGTEGPGGAPNPELLTALYQEQILKHYRHPHHKGAIEAPHAEATAANPVCGEAMTVMLRRDGDHVTEVAFVGQTCAISQASASMMTELARGKEVSEIVALAGRLADLLRGDAGAAADPALGELRALGGVARIPIRIPCAILPWRALTNALTTR